jgi:predicted O-methyltransferase YrrM
LELGTFTGYATACFLEGAAIVGDILNDSYPGGSQKGPFVLSLERDVRAFTLAARHLQALSKHEMGNDCANELSRIREMELEDIEMDSFTFKYKNAGCEITRVNDALAFVEALSIQDSTMYSPFDLIFIDADKTRLLEYVEVCLKNDKVLKKGGIIIVDNVLWKGGVIGQGQSPIGADDDNSALSMKTDAEIKKSRRARKMANVMHQFNTNIVKDNRVEVVILPLRDGLSLIRKKI